MENKVTDNSLSREVIIETQGVSPPTVSEDVRIRGSGSNKFWQGNAGDILKFLNEGTNSSASNANIRVQVADFLHSKKKERKLNPQPNFKVRKSYSVTSKKKLEAEMKPKTQNASKKNKESPRSSEQDASIHKELSKTIKTLKKTIETLSRQLEEEKAKNDARSVMDGNPHTNKRREDITVYEKDNNAIIHGYSGGREMEIQEVRQEGTPSKRLRPNPVPLSLPEAAGPSIGSSSSALTSQELRMDPEDLHSQPQGQPSQQMEDDYQRDDPSVFSRNAVAVKPPIINIVESSQQITFRLLKETLGLNSFIIKRLNKNKHYVQLDNLVDYKAVIDTLTLRQIKFYTYTPKSLKNRTLLLKGIDASFSTDEILIELKDLNLQKVEFVGVSHFTKTSSNLNSKTLPFFLVKISPESDINALTKIKYLLHQVVVWERIIKKEPTMCHRCQRAGHTASNCNLEFRCVKCMNSHSAGNCIIKKGEIVELSKIFCVRCKCFGHPASYKGCPKYKEIKDRLTGKMAKRSENKIEALNRIKNNLNPQSFRYNVSFAQVTKNNSSSQPKFANINPQKENVERRWTSQPSPSHSRNVHNLAQEVSPNIMGDHLVEFKNSITQHFLRLENLINLNSINIQKLHDIYFGNNLAQIETNTNSENLIQDNSG